MRRILAAAALCAAVAHGAWAGVGRVNPASPLARMIRQSSSIPAASGGGGGGGTSTTTYDYVVTTTLATGLELWVKMNDAGTTATDYSGHARNGTVVGGVTQGVTSIVKSESAGMRFDGSSGYLAMPTLANSLERSGGCLAVWCKLALHKQWIVSHIVADLDHGFYWTRYDGVLQLQTFVNAGTVNTGSLNPPTLDGSVRLDIINWTNATGSGVVEFYENGTGYPDDIGGSGSLNSGVGTDPFWIAHDPGSLGNGWSSDGMQAVALWSRTLNGTERAALYAFHP